MQTIIATETLKTGEPMRIEVVLPPDAEREPQIKPFLAHKPPNYLAHIEAAFAGQCDALETRFYIGLVGEEVVGNIMTTEAGGVGIFGHVYTRPDQRRKGICRAIMHHQMEDFRQRGGHVLLLGTGYQSNAYYIYESFGFRDWNPGHPGLMRYDVEPQAVFEARYFGPSPYRVVPAQWKHWPLITLLASVPSPAYLRSLTLKTWGVTLLEGPYCEYLYDYGGSSQATAVALESETGATVAFATLVPDGRSPGARLLDVLSHPNLSGAALVPLLAALPLSATRIHCYADPRDSAKIAALEALGFTRVAVLPAHYRQEETWQDVWLYTHA